MHFSYEILLKTRTGNVQKRVVALKAISEHGHIRHQVCVLFFFTGISSCQNDDKCCGRRISRKQSRQYREAANNMAQRGAADSYTSAGTLCNCCRNPSSEVDHHHLE
jgi:hypothetical protein